MTTLVTYSDHTCTISKQVCCEAALTNGVDVCWPQSPDTISEEFKRFNPILSEHRGGGYWQWKPYVIYQAILKCNDGDTLIYCDAGVKIIENVNHIINVMDQDLFLFSNGHQHVHWCKGDVMQAINESSHFTRVIDDPAYQSLQQVQASVIFIRVNDFTRSFIKEWLMWCQMPGFIDDSPSKLPNHPEFAQHRYDQAILTCMAIKYGIKLHYWADALWYWSQRSRWPDDHYPLLFEHHRRRDPGAVTDPEGPTW